MMKCERCDKFAALLIDDGFESAICVECVRAELRDLVYAGARVLVEDEVRGRASTKALGDLEAAVSIGSTMKVLRHTRQDVLREDAERAQKKRKKGKVF